MLFFISLQVDEIYHDESLGTDINVVLVRMIMVGYRQVSNATDLLKVCKHMFKSCLLTDCV